MSSSYQFPRRWKGKGKVKGKTLGTLSPNLCQERPRPWTRALTLAGTLA